MTGCTWGACSPWPILVITCAQNLFENLSRNPIHKLRPLRMPSAHNTISVSLLWIPYLYHCSEHHISVSLLWIMYHPIQYKPGKIISKFPDWVMLVPVRVILKDLPCAKCMSESFPMPSVCQRVFLWQVYVREFPCCQCCQVYVREFPCAKCMSESFPVPSVCQRVSCAKCMSESFPVSSVCQRVFLYQVYVREFSCTKCTSYHQIFTSEKL